MGGGEPGAGVRLILGDCLAVLPTIESQSIDAVICDPPYPCIQRPYGRLTEAEWWALIVEGVIPQVRRILKPTGSAVFVLQPNSRKVGSMRGWLWEFMAWACREWNMVQDAWWFNQATAPTVHSNRERGLMRPSAKACVWLGPEDCYRDQEAILQSPSEATLADKRSSDDTLRYSPSGHHGRHKSRLSTCVERGGVTPFNVWVGAHSNGKTFGHGASTPAWLIGRWLRYICPAGGTVLDPFVGSGTVALEALKLGRNAVGIERDPGYHRIAERRVADALNQTPLFSPAGSR